MTGQRMRFSTPWTRSACAILLAALGPISPARADLVTPGTTVPVSVAPSGEMGNSASDVPLVSADGRYLTFASFATNLVPGDTDPFRDIYQRDMVTGQISRVTLKPDGSQLGVHVGSFSMSHDGRRVAFVAYQQGVLLWDRLTGTTREISATADGPVKRAFEVSLSGDGTRAIIGAFDSSVLWTEGAGLAVNLTDADGAPVDGESFSLSPDGRFVTYTRWAPDPVFGVVWLLDLQTGVEEMISDGLTFSFGSVVGTGGRFVMYVWYPPTNVLTAHLVVVDRLTGFRDILLNAIDPMGGGTMTPDGRHVAFASLGAISPNPLTPVPGVYVWDRAARTVTLVSTSSQGVPAVIAWGGTMSPDGRFVGLAATDALEEGDTNNHGDAYLRDRLGRCDLMCAPLPAPA